MKVFASWSGQASRDVAELFRRWLPYVQQEIDVWVSSQDIGKGDKWSMALWDSLSEHDIGLVILTRNNISAPWILFEAGALSKSVKSRVIPVLCGGIDRLEIASSPLNQLQNITISKEEVLSLCQVLNGFCDRSLPDDRLTKVFEKWWPEFIDPYNRIVFPGNVDDKGQVETPDRMKAIEESLRFIMDTLKRNEQGRGVETRPLREHVVLESQIIDDLMIQIERYSKMEDGSEKVEALQALNAELAYRRKRLEQMRELRRKAVAG